jgi:hypothetical protein
MPVTDNTNADPDTRAHWIALAKKLKVPIRCILFTAPPRLCEHNDTVRALNVGPDVRFPAHLNPAYRSSTTSLWKWKYAVPWTPFSPPSIIRLRADYMKVQIVAVGANDRRPIRRNVPSCPNLPSPGSSPDTENQKYRKGFRTL